MDDPDGGFVCDGGYGYGCGFTRCLSRCETQSDCPVGFFCVSTTGGTACFPPSPAGTASLAALQCLTGTPDAGVECIFNQDCAFNQVCDAGSCVSFPSCAQAGNGCPDGTTLGDILFEDCASCPGSGVVEFPMPDDPDGGIVCPSGTVNVCVVNRCLMPCSSLFDCPGGLVCFATPGSTGSLCAPYPYGTTPNETVLECLGQ